MTKGAVKKLAAYYAAALKDNASDVKKMQQAVFASLFHSYSTNTGLGTSLVHMVKIPGTTTTGTRPRSTLASRQWLKPSAQHLARILPRR